MAGSRINVTVRTRPCEWRSKCGVHIDEHGEELSVQADQFTHRFHFEKILHGASQQKVFQEVGVDAINTALGGVNATVIAYGQTGAGKTHTLTGSRNAFQERGIIPRALSHLFQNTTNSAIVAISLRYIEIYNEALFDLLTTADTPASITLTEPKDVIIPHGAVEVVLNDEQHALETFFRGEASRVTREHALNRDSSRSHSICIVQLRTRKDPQDLKVVKSLLTLVDLAGSERVMKTRSDGVVLKEAGYINKSLTFLEQVAIAISEGRQHVPYRSAKLTHLLKHALGGNSKTSFIANIWDDIEQKHETLSTLRFAQRMSQIETAISTTPAIDHDATIAQYAQEIKTLKAALAGVQAQRTPKPPQTLQLANPAEQLVQQVLPFLQAHDEHLAWRALSQIDLSSVSAVRHTLCAARVLFQRYTSSNGINEHPSEERKSAGSEPCCIPDCTVPLGSADVAAAAPGPSESPSVRGDVSDPGVVKKCEDTRGCTSGLADALRFFKTHIAVGVEALMQARANEVAITKKRVKALALQINAEKEKIDGLSSGASGSRDQDMGGELDHCKAVYRALYEQMQHEKQELAQSSDSLQHLKLDFQERFQSWYNSSYMARSCDDDDTHQSTGTRPRSIADGQCGNSGSTCPALSNKDLQDGQNSSQGFDSRHKLPPDYNDESRSFYDAQRKLALSVSSIPSHGKLGHLGKGWRISG